MMGYLLWTTLRGTLQPCFIRLNIYSIYVHIYIYIDDEYASAKHALVLVKHAFSCNPSTAVTFVCMWGVLGM